MSTLPPDFAAAQLPLVTRDGVLRREHCEAIYKSVVREEEPWLGLFDAIGRRAVAKRGADYRVKRALELLKQAGLIRWRRRRWEVAL